jgi:acyl transferase domain-containing protein
MQDSPLMEAGIDSLSATELSQQLRALSGAALSPTLVFEHPTSRAIAAHLLTQVAPPVAAVACLELRGSRDAEGTNSLDAAVHLIGSASRWPGGAVGTAARAVLHASGDAITEVPSVRWMLGDEHDVSELSAQQLACVRHGGFLVAASDFDAHAFGISPAEAHTMDPQQRLLLEQCYESLHSVSERRAALFGRPLGVHVAIERPDWSIVLQRTPSLAASVYAVTGDNVSVAAGRISFCLGLHGPAASIDTACSSALVAVHAVRHLLSAHECDQALAAATSLKLVPEPTLGIAAAGMLSIDGRCKTFDARANGYLRSEAIGALTLAVSCAAGPQLCGSAVRQDGRSASLTAPNGSAQRLLMRAVAALRPSEGAVLIEAHGTGTSLGDPTEAGTLADVFAASRSSALVGAAKANVGHAEAASGLVGVLKGAWQLTAASLAVGNAKLRQLNGLVRESCLRSGGGVAMPNQCMRCAQANGLVGVNAFGYSGTISHAVLAAHVPTSEAGARGETRLVFDRRDYGWGGTAKNPLLQRALRSGVDALFRSPAAGALHALVADHVVQARTVFPGAGYLEMARAACCASAANSLDARLRGVFFLQPLETAVAGLVVECAVNDSRFEVRSGELEGGGELNAAALHCTGKLAATTLSVQTPSPLPEAWRHRCVQTAACSALYGAFHVAGLQYGPAFQTLEQAWTACGEQGKRVVEAAARLRPRTVRQGSLVHPADLDGALQLTATASPTGGGGEARVPFALDTASLRSAAGELWAAVRRSHGSESVGVRLGPAARAAGALIDGLKARALRTSSKRVAVARHMYSTEWIALGGPPVAAANTWSALMVAHASRHNIS